jgi:cysteine synthase
LIDDAYRVSDEEAIKMSRFLVRQDGKVIWCQGVENHAEFFFW